MTQYKFRHKYGLYKSIYVTALNTTKAWKAIESLGFDMRDYELDLNNELCGKN